MVILQDLRNGSRMGEIVGLGYGGKIEVPTVQMIFNEIAIAGSLVGNDVELVELMDLNARGLMKVHSRPYRLDQINQAIDDFKNRRYIGRAVIIP